MNRIWTNSHGNMYQTSIGGTYPVNNGDPQCDVDFDEDEDEDEDEYDEEESDPL